MCHVLGALEYVRAGRVGYRYVCASYYLVNGDAVLISLASAA